MRSLLLAVFAVPMAVQAQELSCDVKVQAPKIQMADPALFRDLETAIREFMNNTKWTNDNFEPVERIKCQLVITISNEISMDEFNAEVSIVSSRPVYNSDYETVLFNHYDKDWYFRYRFAEPLEYSENTSLSNLTSLLAFYAYIIIGFDYDAFSKSGGTPWFLKAQGIVNTLSDKPGWTSYGSTRGRYWLVENLVGAKYATFRSAFYTYHLKGLDEFYTNPATATRVFIGVLSDLDKVNKDQPNSMILQVFFNSKKQELMDIFAGAPPAERVKASNLLCSLDPANCDAYRKAIG